MLSETLSQPQFHDANIQKVKHPITIRYKDIILAQTKNALVMLEYSNRGFLPPRYYIPISDIKMEALSILDKSTHCPIKGDCTYYGLKAEDNKEVAWAYHQPVEGASQIKQHLAFYPQNFEITL